MNPFLSLFRSFDGYLFCYNPVVSPNALETVARHLVAQLFMLAEIRGGYGGQRETQSITSSELPPRRRDRRATVARLAVLFTLHLACLLPFRTCCSSLAKTERRPRNLTPSLSVPRLGTRYRLREGGGEERRN